MENTKDNKALQSEEDEHKTEEEIEHIKEQALKALNSHEKHEPILKKNHDHKHLLSKVSFEEKVHIGTSDVEEDLEDDKSPHPQFEKEAHPRRMSQLEQKELIRKNSQLLDEYAEPEEGEQELKE